ncbi:MAG: sporulation integral membrane protein YtvI [Clostridiales bacterium]|nr:sporulation integral membrane protein YtvI [Clostridiales bacterium]
MKVERRKNFLINFFYFALIIGLGYIGLKHLVPALLPFVIGLVIAVIFKGPADKLAKRTGIKRAYISIIILIVFYAIFFGVVALVGAQLVSFLQESVYKIPGFYTDTIEPFLIELTDRFFVKYPQFENHIDGIIDSVSDSVYSFLTNLSTSLVSGAALLATKIPSLLINSVFTIVSSFFFTIDYHDVTEFVFRQLPEQTAIQARGIKENVIVTLWKYAKSYAFLMSVTFVELTIGMVILGVGNPLALGAIVAIIDVLPVLGTGTVLIPWAIIGFVFGDYKIGIGMLLLYVIITAVRQTLEPRVIGKQIGLHPIATLVSIFVGGQLFGIVGIFLVPILLTVIKQMNDEGVIHLFK